MEGLSKSAIARVKGIAWNTVDRWLERAAACCREFNDQHVTDIAVDELQADEIRTIVDFLCPNPNRQPNCGGASAIGCWTLDRKPVVG